MKRLLAATVGALALSVGLPALASTCPANPYTLTNGSLADATQVMADFNNLLNCLNLNVAPLQSPTFAGTVTMPAVTVTGAAAVTGAASLSSTLSVAGAATLSGGLSVSGGAVAVIGGVSTGGGTYFTATPSNFGSGNPQLFIQKTSGNPSGWTIGSFDGVTVGGGGLSLNWATITTTGTFATNSLTVTSGLTVGGGVVSLPVASIVNADLDTVNAGPGTYGSATQAAVATVNGQGRVTSVSSTKIMPDTCGSTANGTYCENAEGYIHEWGATGSISAGGSVTITLPLACTSTQPLVQVTASAGGTNGGSAYALSTSQFSVTNNKSIASSFSWSSDCN